MTEIHPEFCTHTRRWYVDGYPGARTIRELLQMLPSGTTVRDYFPGGREVTAAERGFCVNDMRDAANKLRPKLESWLTGRADFRRREAPAQHQVHGRTQRNPREARQKYDRDRVLDLWRSGHSGPEIEKKLKMPAGTAMPLIQTARQRGEARAVKATSREWLEARAARTNAPAQLRRYKPRTCAANREIVMVLTESSFDQLDIVARKHGVARATLARLLVDAAVCDAALCARVGAVARGLEVTA